jgi:hypothetical protein
MERDHYVCAAATAVVGDGPCWEQEEPEAVPALPIEVQSLPGEVAAEVVKTAEPATRAAHPKKHGKRCRRNRKAPKKRCGGRTGRSQTR